MKNGQPVYVNGGFGAYFGAAATVGRAIVMLEDGSLLNTSDESLKPLVKWDGTVWLDTAETYNFPAWNDHTAVANMARLHAVARNARVMVTKALAYPR